MLTYLLRYCLQGCHQILGLVTPVDPSIRVPVVISFGAIAGALSRYYLTIFCTRWLGTGFPFGTFLINLSGALAMGFFVTLVTTRGIVSPDWQPLIAVGFLGSYTTFSTYALDTSVLLQSGHKSLGLYYWLGSACLGFLSLELGRILARRIL
ncbi:MAG: fluoride efflux transporter CrcB [Acaryochloridaceae cyanobacterium SU_2_1]|nr:fluoride efflux transporter CrcB [Acaryochloridaceae cyanobacterium SU_2_1]